MEMKIKPVPNGYRLAKAGEKITEGMIFRDSRGYAWTLVYPDGRRRFVDGPGAKVFGRIAYAIPAKAKPAKPIPKAKWAKIPLDTKITKSGLIDITNELGTENAKLKNQIAKGKAK